MIRKTFFTVAMVAMVSLLSFTAKAQDAQIQRGAGKRCTLLTRIEAEQARYSSSQIHGNAVIANWKITRKSPDCPIRQLRVVVVLQTVKTKHAEAETLRLEQLVTPGKTQAIFKIPAHKVVIFSASDARLKIATTIAPIF